MGFFKNLLLLKCCNKKLSTYIYMGSNSWNFWVKEYEYLFWWPLLNWSSWGNLYFHQQCRITISQSLGTQSNMRKCLNIVLGYISLIKSDDRMGKMKKNPKQNNCLFKELPHPQSRGFYNVYTEEFQNCCVSVTCMRLLFFPFPKGNECCVCFIISAHRLIEPKSPIQTR